MEHGLDFVKRKAICNVEKGEQAPANESIGIGSAHRAYEMSCMKGQSQSEHILSEFSEKVVVVNFMCQMTKLW